MISVVTVTYNASSFIEPTIQSVYSQRNRNCEFLLIDGTSKDDTVTKVKRLLQLGQFQVEKVALAYEKECVMVDAENKAENHLDGKIELSTW